MDWRIIDRAVEDGSIQNADLETLNVYRRELDRMATQSEPTLLRRREALLDVVRDLIAKSEARAAEQRLTESMRRMHDESLAINNQALATSQEVLRVNKEANQKSWVDKLLARLAEHRLLRWLVLFGFVVSLVAGTVTSIQTIVNVFRKEKAGPEKLVAIVEIQNQRTNVISLQHLCLYTITESAAGMSRSTFPETAGLFPVNKSKGASPYEIGPGSSRKFQISAAEKFREYFDNGVAMIEVEIHLADGQTFRRSIPFFAGAAEREAPILKIP